jgi:hypothetical protein
MGWDLGRLWALLTARRVVLDVPKSDLDAFNAYRRKPGEWIVVSQGTVISPFCDLETANAEAEKHPGNAMIVGRKRSV